MPIQEIMGKTAEDNCCNSSYCHETYNGIGWSWWSEISGTVNYPNKIINAKSSSLSDIYCVDYLKTKQWTWLNGYLQSIIEHDEVDGYLVSVYGYYVYYYWNTYFWEVYAQHTFEDEYFYNQYESSYVYTPF